jgi:fibronectin-binding autotransporter adhesin
MKTQKPPSRRSLLNLLAVVALAGLTLNASGQIQVAGNLLVDVDATGAPVGNLAYLTNNGAAGGVFIAKSNGVANVTPQVIALGGSGTRGVLLDGNQVSLQHYTDTSGATIQLTPAGLVGGVPVFSVEAWAYKHSVMSETALVAWGNRINGMNVSCNWGRHITWGGFSWQGGNWDHGWNNVPSAGAWHHLVWTYDGAGNLNLYQDGVLDKAVFQAAAVNVESTNNIVLGVQHANAGWNGFANGLLAKVRIHDGVLAPAQIAANYAFEAPTFTTGPGSQDLVAPPNHRWSFNQPAANSAVGLTVPDTGSTPAGSAIVRGTGSNANFDGDQLNLNGGASSTNSYVDLPNFLLSSQSSSNGGPGQITFEMWVNPTSQNWTRLMDFGTNAGNGEITAPGGSTSGRGYFMIAAQVGTDLEHSRIEVLNVANVGSAGTIGSRLVAEVARNAKAYSHYTATWDEASNQIKFYLNGVLAGSYTVAHKMNAVVDVNNWLGRSAWSGDNNMGGAFREFRIYNRVLSDAEVRRNYLVGPADNFDPAALVWNGNVNGNWDASTANWLADATAASFTDGANVVLNDLATGTTTVSLSGTVSPASVTVANDSRSYAIGGAGKISGSGGLSKGGGNTLTFTGAQVNDYTGPTLLNAGKTVVSVLANGGSPSALGAASSDPTNLVLKGTLSYQGSSVAIDRGLLLAGPSSTLEVQNSLTLSGKIVGAGQGGFAKTGPGTLVFANSVSNMLSGGAGPGFNVVQGTVVFDGNPSGGTQTNRITGETWVGGTLAYPGHMVLSNTTLLQDTWFGIGRGNGSIGNLSTMRLENSRLIIAANGLAIGYQPGYNTNFASQALTLNGTSSLFAPGAVNVGESSGSAATINLNGSSWLRGSQIRLGISAGSSGSVTIANSAAITNANFTSVGTAAATAVYPGGAGTMVIKDNGGFYSVNDFNVSDVGAAVGGSSGQLDLLNNATLTTGYLYVGKGLNCVGVLNQSGGTLSVLGTGANVGSAAGSTGTLNVSGGVFGMTNATASLIVGSAGNGTLNVSGTGSVNAPNALMLGNASGASGVVNLDGGTITTKRVYMGNAGASSYFAFNGGILKAADGASVDFLSGLGSVYVSVSGAKIDSGNNDITIAQDLFDSGGGGLTKLGAGTLRLPGYLYYTGPTLVNAGKLAISTRATGTANVTVADGAEFSVQVQDFLGAAVNPANLTAGATTGAAITVDLGGFGNPANAPLNVSAGTLTANGTITVNLDPNSYVSSAGEIPLISYGALAGSGTFVLGTLPPGVFGYLTNDTAASPKFIGVVVTSIKLPRWEGLAGGTWDIQVTTNWVDSVTLLPDYFYQGSRAVFDDQALGVTSVALNTTVTPGGVVVSNSALNYTISGTGRIGGNSGLTKLSTGTLTLSTTNNNYTGPTVIDGGGTLVTTVTNNLGTNGTLRMGTGTLSIGGNNQRFNATYVTNGNISASGATVTAASHNLAGGSITAVLAGGSLTTFGTNGDTASIFALNTYTGRTVLAGNPLVVTNLANGGSPSGVGTASANPTNLVFEGGTLTYAGTAATTDRGYTVASGGTLSTVGNLTLTGLVSPAAGNFIKSGPATLTYVRPGTNILSAGRYDVGQGTVLLDGGASTPGNYLQTNRVGGDMWVGFDQVNAGNLILTNTSLNAGGWLAIDRGNGSVGSSSKVTLYDSVMTVGNFSMGDDNGIVGNSSFSVLTLLGNSAVTANARSNIGEDPGADARVIVAGTSRLAQTTEWFALGNSGKGTLVLSNSARVSMPGDYNLGDIAGGDGTLDIYDNATNLALTLYVGKGNDSGPATGVVNQYGGYMGKSAAGGGDWRIGGNSSITTAGSVGTYNLYGGVFEQVNNFQIGAWGTGYWNQYGGIANCGSWPAVGRYPGSFGFMTVSGGVFNQTATGNRLIVAEEGTGTLTITNTGLVTSAGGVSIGHQATGAGVVNLDGGTLRTTIILQPGVGAQSTFNFNGGVLQASVNNATFMAGLGEAKVFARGAVIDSDAYSITIGQPLLDGSGGGGLIKLGAGTLALGGVNTYTGSTVVSNGTLLVNGSIGGAVTVKSGGTLGGTGTIAGTVTVEAGGALGAGSSIGTLTLGSSPVLAGAVVAELDRNGGTPQADRIVLVGNPVAYGGTLVLTNTGAPLQAGDTFTLFNASGYSGSFTLASQTPGQVVAWNTANLTVNGSITVSSAGPLTPPTMTNSISGNTITLTWPAEYLGWVLQTQTNNLSTGLANNWVDVAGSGASTTAAIPVNPENPTVFIRLRSP